MEDSKSLSPFLEAATSSVAKVIADTRREAERQRELHSAEHRALVAELDKRVSERLAELNDIRIVDALMPLLQRLLITSLSADLATLLATNEPSKRQMALEIADLKLRLADEEKKRVPSSDDLTMRIIATDAIQHLAPAGVGRQRSKKKVPAA